MNITIKTNSIKKDENLLKKIVDKANSLLEFDFFYLKSKASNEIYFNGCANTDCSLLLAIISIHQYKKGSDEYFTSFYGNESIITIDLASQIELLNLLDSIKSLESIKINID